MWSILYVSNQEIKGLKTVTSPYNSHTLLFKFQCLIYYFAILKALCLVYINDLSIVLKFQMSIKRILEQ